MLVTRHKRLTDEPNYTGETIQQRRNRLGITNEPRPNLDLPLSYFVDWISIRQTHEEPQPIITDGVVMGVNGEGELDWQTHRAKRITGSFDTSLSIRCDGHTVVFSGNISRFGESDNVFGLDLAAAIRKVNETIAKLGLAPFTAGRRYITTKQVHGERTGAFAWTGAVISRLDLTQNFATGSMQDARAYLEFLASQQGSARTKVGTHGDGETVDWNRGSRRWYQKVYIKATELAKHGLSEHHAARAFCEAVGLVRNEVTYKSTQLQTLNCNYLGGFSMKQLELDLQARQNVLTRATHEVDDLEELPNHFRRTARDYLAGDDLRNRLSLATFKRHRAALLPYGLDIAVRRNVVNFRPKVRVIELKPVSLQDFLQFKDEFDKRHAA